MFKKSVLALVLLACQFSFAGNAPRPYERTAYTTTLTRFDVDAKLDLGLINGGNLMLDFTAAKPYATVTLYRPFHCPAGVMCAMVMPASVTVKLPVVSVKEDACNIVTTIATEDARPRDGGYESLKIVDYSRTRCKISFMGMTTIEYATISAGFGAPVRKTRSTFVGDRFNEERFVPFR